MSTLRCNAIQDTAGVERYLARAWVNFNGTGTVAIRAAGNVTSITDNGTGDYTVNFTNAMPDANYGQVVTAGGQAIIAGGAVTAIVPRTTAGCRVYIWQRDASNNAADNPDISVAIFR